MQRFLDPTVLAGISSLDLLAKTVVDGFVVASIDRRISASARSSRSIALMFPVTTCAMWIGICLRGPSAAT